MINQSYGESRRLYVAYVTLRLSRIPKGDVVVSGLVVYAWSLSVCVSHLCGISTFYVPKFGYEQTHHTDAVRKRR